MIQRDDSASRANFEERATSHVSRVETTDAIDINFEIFLPRLKKKRREKKRAVSRKNEGSGEATRS